MRRSHHFVDNIEVCRLSMSTHVQKSRLKFEIISTAKHTLILQNRAHIYNTFT